MRSMEFRGGAARMVPAIILLGVTSLSACRSDEQVRGIQPDGPQGPSFDCTRANYFQLTGTNGYVRAKAVRRGKPVILDAIRITAPGTGYDETFPFDEDGSAFVSDNAPIPRRAGEISMHGILGDESDLCSTDYEPFREFVPPPIDPTQQ